VKGIDPLTRNVSRLFNPRTDHWKITHDPFVIRVGEIEVVADLGAEKAIAAEKGKRKIVVEIKSFIGLSMMNELEKAHWKIRAVFCLDCPNRARTSGLSCGQ